MVQLRAEIDSYLNQVDDSFLRVVHSMLTTYMEEKHQAVIGYDTNGKPLSADKAKALFKERLVAMEQGDFISNEELRKEAETW